MFDPGSHGPYQLIGLTFAVPRRPTRVSSAEITLVSRLKTANAK